jgi:multidrug resistance protein, MATE family
MPVGGLDWYRGHWRQYHRWQPQLVCLCDSNDAWVRGEYSGGYHVGAKDYARAAKVARLSVLISATYAFLASLVLVLGREVLPRIYTSDPAVLALTAEVLLIVAAYQFFDCTQATIIGALRGYKDTQYPMIISIIGYWLIALPVGTILGWGLLGLNLGVLRFWIGLGFGVGFVALFALVRLYRTSRDADRISQFSRI